MSPSHSIPPPLAGDSITPARSNLATILSLVLLMFLATGVASFLDSSLLLFFHRQDLSVVSGLQGLLMLFIGVVTYGMIAFAPSIPKRHFLPVSLFLPVAY